ncbi:MAG: TetR/AcrR family transcriptional regulator [Candidatus Zixiibacteriota bacterium]
MKLGAEERRNQILEEATKLFSVEGYDKVTTKRLAAACSVTEPALYRYFASKELIYDAVLDSLETRLQCDDIYGELDSENDLGQLLTRIANQLLNCAQKHQEVYRLLLYSALGGHSKARAVYQSIRGRHAKYLQLQLDRLVTMGLIVDSNNEITARSFLGMIFDCALGLTLWKNSQGKSFRCEEIVANNVPIFVDGLSRKTLRK